MSLIIDPHTNKVINESVHSEPEIKNEPVHREVKSIIPIETKVIEVKKESHIPPIHTNPILPTKSKIEHEFKYTESELQDRITKAVNQHKHQNPNIDKNKTLEKIRNILWGTGMDSQQFEKSMIEITKLFN